MLHNALVLMLALQLLSASPASSCTEQDKRSLIKFLAGLSQDGGLAASWLPDVDCCRAWEGVACDRNGTVVTEVSLPARGLHGRISPSSLANLGSLTLLNLSHNALSGDLPPELISSTSLLVLDVSYNSLDGVLPPTTVLKQPLQVLNISSNKFAAEFPPWNTMANLIALNASNNSFTGQMPAASLCRASPSLALLDLSYNLFTGEVSPALADCTMLKVLKAGRNNLSGILPFELFDMTSLEHLSFPNNGLEGELDGSHMAKLSNLVTLDLGGNCFHGKIPESIGQLKKLEELTLGNNNMSGNLPSSLGNCTSLTTIDLKINSFSGDLGNVDFSALHNLKTLDLLHNNFSGELDLSCNYLTGRIPEALNKLNFLSELNISNNDLEGPIPTGDQMSTFSSFSFDGNPRLCGSVLGNTCDSVKAVHIITAEDQQCGRKIIFAIAFGVFFGIGVLYDQLVLFRYFG
ncbi:hypothetical protein E2562_038337 [Oryza meyeriana var. granulata]|uniref:non-specific serine/threonine protein kinase n=1 Tax=Oryza meyeriana var. granulata TaxID=110450 RepID=A0A6G1FGG6_9ORYZ|nr:hypothetical protein E2562_038337 [Oryza meyeriana var. granulata]